VRLKKYFPLALVAAKSANHASASSAVNPPLPGRSSQRGWRVPKRDCIEPTVGGVIELELAGHLPRIKHRCARSAA
jgi:hypothetical protein